MAYDLTGSPLYQLMLKGHHYKLPKGQVVQALNDRNMFNLIKAGYVKRYLITAEGNKSVQVIYGPNDYFPMTPVFVNIFETNLYRGQEQYYYESMTELEIYSVSIDELRQFVTDDPLLYKDLLYAAGTRFNTYIHRLEDRSLKSGLYRVAHLLTFMADQFQAPSAKGIAIVLPLTHQDIAEVLDLTRETVSRELSRLKNRGLITSGRNIEVLDLDGLRKIFS